MATTPPPAVTTHVEVDLQQGRLRLQGELLGAAGAELYEAVQGVISARPAAVHIDLSAVPRMDSLGGAWLIRVSESLRQADLQWQVEGEQGQVRDFLQLMRAPLDTPPTPPPRQPGFFETIGEAIFTAGTEAKELLALGIDTIYWGILAPCMGRGLRWRSLVEELAAIGVRATFLVVLMNALMGLVIAIMSAAQLRQFGAEIFVADLVGIAFARELAALMTAIIVTARSGSAITAELATMVVQEEIDALKSMGFNVAQFLVVPKFWAMLLAMPALTLLAMLAGFLGGMEMGVLWLGVNPQNWLRETLARVTLQDVWQGLVKSLVFGVAIVFIGCHNGLRVRGGAQAVGQATTRAVVMDVVFIVILDMLFALFFEFVV